MSDFELVFRPQTGTWEQVKVDGSRVMDYVGLTPGGVAQRYNKADIVAALKKAIVELEA